MENTGWQRLTRTGPAITAIGQREKEGYNSPVALTKVTIFRNMEDEFMKRGYLLPDGCKDLMDVLKLKAPKHASTDPLIFAGWAENYFAEVEKKIAALPPIKEEMVIPRQISVSQLGQILTEKSSSASGDVGPGASWQAGMISFKPYAPLVFRDLMKMRLCEKVTDMLDFETISKILGKYGVTCKLGDP